MTEISNDWTELRNNDWTELSKLTSKVHPNKRI